MSIPKNKPLSQITKDDNLTKVTYLNTTTSTDEKLILLWLNSQKVSTRKTYSYNIDQFFYLVGTEVKDIKLDHIINYQNYLIDNYSQNSVKTKIATVKSLFTFAFKTGYISINPMNLISTGTGTSAINQRFIEEDILLDIIYKNRNEKNIKATVLSLLLYKTAMRISEAIKLKWNDFCPCQNGYIITIMGKGNKQRVINIDREFYSFICQLKSDSIYVFTGYKEEHLKRTQGYNLVKDFFADIPELSPHWLRHCHSIHSLDNGVPIDDLRKSLGHSTLVMTSRYLDARPSKSSSQFIKI